MSGQAHFTHLFHQPFSGGGFFLLPHDAGLLIVLPFFHLGKNAGLFHLLFKAAQGDVEIIIVLVQENSWQKYHPLLKALEARWRQNPSGLCVFRLGRSPTFPSYSLC